MEMTKATTVYIIDLLVEGANHILFNTSVCKTISEVHKCDSVIFVAESVHLQFIRNALSGNENLEYCPYDASKPTLIKKRRILRWISQRLFTYFIIFKYLRLVNKSSTRKVYFTCLSTSGFFFANLISLLYDVQVIIFVHGEVEYIFTKERSFLKKIRGIMYSFILKHLSSNVHLVFLSPLVKEMLEENGYKTNRIYSIEHPLPSIDVDISRISEESIIFGHLGVASKNKNSRAFFNLAEYFKSSIISQKTCFYLLGKVEDDDLSFESPIVFLAGQNQRIAQNEFELYIAQIDYAIFTFEGLNYVYRASGTVMDAIYYGKPIIAIKHRYFDFLFDIGGNIGFLCKDFEEMKLVIDSIIQRQPSYLNQYHSQQQALETLKLKYNGEALNDLLKSI